MTAKNETNHRRTIGQLAAELGIGVETIRYYERRGLISRPARVAGGYRHYGDDVAAMIRYIRLAQALGLSLKDVERVKDHLDRGSTFCEVLRTTAGDRLAAATREIVLLEQRVADLTAFLARCEARDPETPCSIVRELSRIEHAAHPSFAQTGTEHAESQRAAAH